MKTRHMTNIDQKIDELKSYIEEQFCSRDKNYVEIYMKTLRKKIELQLKTELKKTKQKNRTVRI